MLKFLITGLILTLPLMAAAGRINVCSSCPVPSITLAIEKAQPGDTIFIESGLYKEGNIVIDKPLVFIGIDFQQIDGDNEYEIFTVKADSVVIMGIQFQNIGTNYIEDRAAINIVKSQYIRIEGNRLINTIFGIYLENSKNCLVKDNYIKGDVQQEISSGNAIHAWYCKNLHIEGNTVINHRDGIYLEFVDSSSIVNNISKDNLRYGLHFMFSDVDKYINNHFESNGAGVAVMFSKYIRMQGNNFVRNWGAASYGLLLKEITDGVIEGNLFSENTIGIYAESASRMNIVGNDFIRNGWALKILGSCVDNRFESNNFISNTFDLITNSAKNSNEYVRNYWSAYSGYDLDHDGIGDIPYRPIKLFSHVVSLVPTSIVLLRSLFIDLINFAETVTPIFTPETLTDDKPLIRKIKR